MSRENTYFILNKNMDYSGGYMEHITVTDGCLSIEDGYSSGFMFSPVLDSGSSGTVWGRAVLDAQYGKDSYFSVGFYCVESPLEKEACEDIILSGSYSLPDKLHMLADYQVAEVSNAKDILLRKVRGRYLFFKVDFFGQAGDWPSVNSIKISFPYESIIRYLPEIYQAEDNDFLRGYVGMFSSMLSDLEDSIGKAAAHFDPDVAGHDVLMWLGEILSIPDAEIWREEQLRRLIKNAVSLYRKKGTAEGLTSLIKIITLTKPYIVESYALRKYRDCGSMKANLDTLYGNDPYRITIIIEEQAAPSQKEFKALDRLIGFFVPVNVEHVLVKMKNMVLLDHYTYLGLNSYVNGYNDIVIDESVQLSFVKIGK